MVGVLPEPRSERCSEQYSRVAGVRQMSKPVLPYPARCNRAAVDGQRGQLVQEIVGQRLPQDEIAMYPILEAVNAYATLGEITGVFGQVFGEYQEPVFF